MGMIKTDKARLALRDRASMSVQERQILILCDGHRSRQEIASWLGDSAWALLDGLLAQGYLAVQQPGARSPARGKDAALPPAPAALPGAAEAGWAQAARSPLAIETRPASLYVEQTQVSTHTSKRSLAACKMYAVGILQMQRGADSQTLVARLQRSSDESDLLQGLVAMLQFLQQKTNASYAENVHTHLQQILPEQHVQTLGARVLSYS